MYPTDGGGVTEKLQKISVQFGDPICPDHPNAFTEVLHFLSNQISEKSRNFIRWFSDCEKNKGHVESEECSYEEFSERTKSCVHHILISVQKLKKTHVSLETDENDDNEGKIFQLTFMPPHR